MRLTSYFSRVAATFSRIQVILKGLDPDVKSVGIISAWNPGDTIESRELSALHSALNPGGNTPSEEYNEQATRALLRDLRGHKLGPIKLGGHFMDKREGSWLIPNASREFMLKLCRKYGQWSIIYGKKYVDVDDEVGFIFTMLGKNGQQVASKEAVVLTSSYQEPGHEPVEKMKTDFSFFRGDRPKESKIPGQPSPDRKRLVIPFRFPPGEKKEEPTEV